MFDKVDGFIIGYNGTKYLTLLTLPNINISYVVFHGYVRMKINSNNDLL